MPNFQFKDCYDVEELAKQGIIVTYTGGSVDFSYIDLDLNQNILLARFGSFIYDKIKYGADGGECGLDRRYSGLLQPLYPAGALPDGAAVLCQRGL